VIVDQNGPTAASPPYGNYDSFFLSGLGDLPGSVTNGGSWVVNSVASNGYWNGGNSGGCNSGPDEGIVRYRGVMTYGMARNAGSGARAGIESGGDACGVGTFEALPEHSLWIFNSIFYDSYNWGQGDPHGAGAAYRWNDTYFRAGDQQGAINNDECQDWGDTYNSIIAMGSSSKPAYTRSNCAAWSVTNNKFVPKSFNSLWVGAANGNVLAQFSSHCSVTTGTVCATDPDCPGGETCVYAQTNSTYTSPPGFISIAGNHNKWGTANNPKFTAATGSCDTAFNDGAPNWSSCDFTLQADSPAIDAGITYFKANGAGSGATSLVVYPTTSEPDTARRLGFSRPHVGDPRTYFIAPGSWPGTGLGGDTGDVIQIENATCAGSQAEFGNASYARVSSLSQTGKCWGGDSNGSACTNFTDCYAAGGFPIHSGDCRGTCSISGSIQCHQDVDCSWCDGTGHCAYNQSISCSPSSSYSSNCGTCTSKTCQDKSGQSLTFEKQGQSCSVFQDCVTDVAQSHYGQCGGTITLDRACTWADGAGVSLPWVGSAPDMGAFEYGLGPGRTPVPTVNLVSIVYMTPTPTP